MNDPLSGKNKSEVSANNFKFKCHVRPRDLPDQDKTLILEAPSKDEAVQRLLSQGYIILSVEKAGSGGGGSFQNIFSFQAGLSQKGKSKGLSFFQSVAPRELIFFAIQLATLLKAGVPLLRALEIIRRGTANPFFQEILASLNKKISEGSTLSNALRNYSNIFPWVWINLVEVGEATGKLPECLEDVAHYQESSLQIKSKVMTAFFYPAILTTAVIAAVTFLLIFIVPKFQATFEQQHMKLPALTQIVITLSDMVRHQTLTLGIFFASLITVIIVFQKSANLRIYYDTFRLGFPIFGKLLIQVSVVRFSRALKTLLRSSVPILQALDVSGRLIENKFLEQKINEVAHAVKSGQGLGAQLESKKVFPVFMTQLIAVGEESGQLERFLNLIADYYEESVDTFLARLTSMLEPVLLVVMGCVIGVIVISMFLPIIEMSTRGGT